MNDAGMRALMFGAVPARLDCRGAVAALPSKAPYEVA
jgi:hypothetical protein